MNDNTFSIYQLKRNDKTSDLRFMPPCYSSDMSELLIDPDNYEHIYTAPLGDGVGLEDIFTQFNINHPTDFTGHSLSVSDVVVLHKNGQDTAHYVDSFGFAEAPAFFKKG